MNIDKIKCFLLDLDGTIYLGGEPIGDMINTLKKIRKSGRKIVYLTNNSSKSVAEYQKKLSQGGFFDKTDCVFTSATATEMFLIEKGLDKNVYLLGTNSLKEEFLGKGISLDEKNVKTVVISYDTELTYEKLCIATKFIKEGANYIATHPDVNCPSKRVYLPDVGSFISLIETSTGRKPDVICGKPYGIMAKEIKKNFCFSEEEMLMVGDRLSTDIKFAENSGIQSLLVFSGETTEKDYEKSDEKANFTLDTLNDIVNLL